MSKNTLFIGLCFIALSFFSQSTTDKVKVRKNGSAIFFYQTGASSDTIIPNKTDLFFFAVSDSVKCLVDVLVENGQLMRTNVDSIYKLRPMRGMRYLHHKCNGYKIMVDGACEPGNTVTIYVRKKSAAATAEGEKILMTNKFFLK